LRTKKVTLYTAPITDQVPTGFKEKLSDFGERVTHFFSGEGDIAHPGATKEELHERARIEGSFLGFRTTVRPNSRAVNRPQQVLANVYGLTVAQRVKIYPALIEVLRQSRSWSARAIQGANFNANAIQIFESALTAPVDYNPGTKRERFLDTIRYAMNLKYLEHYATMQVAPMSRVMNNFAAKQRNGRRRTAPVATAVPDFQRALPPSGV